MSTTLPDGLKWPQFKSRYASTVGTTSNADVSAAWEAYKGGNRILKPVPGAKVSAAREKKTSARRGKKTSMRGGKGKARAPSPKSTSPVKKAASPVKSPKSGTSHKPPPPSPKSASPKLEPLRKSPPSAVRSPPKKSPPKKGLIATPPGAKKIPGLPAHVKLVPSYDVFHVTVASTMKGTSSFVRDMETNRTFVPLNPLKVIRLLGNGYTVKPSDGILPCTHQWKFLDTNTGAEAYLVDWKQTSKSLGDAGAVSAQELWTKGPGNGTKAVFLVYSPITEFEDELMGALIAATGDQIEDRDFMIKTALIMALGGNRTLNNYSTMAVMALPISEAEKNLSTLREAGKLAYEAEERRKKQPKRGDVSIEEVSERSSGAEDVD